MDPVIRARCRGAPGPCCVRGEGRVKAGEEAAGGEWLACVRSAPDVCERLPDRSGIGESSSRSP